MSRLLRIPLFVLVILALLTSSIGVLRLQYSDPDAWPGYAVQDKNGMPAASATTQHDDHGDAKHPCCGHCNHGCHVVNHLLTHLNSFPAILVIAPFMIPAASLLATPAPSLLADAFFKPPR